ncbi:interferon gamma receptor 1-like isoform X2 [Xiphias gladius]|uniref:interferon gamma receptor 1-like isoform X2 n=1 Tax=Xiphias gladius TaxID=8245 RepID=UPI001A98DDFA|nr:interferon gamma receptor 1-like isoform X2 [Xiphias gladius]
MDSLRLHPVFHICVWLPAVLAQVEPPTNVTLQCHNMHNVLEWSYNQPSPELRFRVTAHPYYGSTHEQWLHPTALQSDVSVLSDPDNSYLIYVTAVIGQNESESAPPDGITFSYFKDSPASQKCSLDLPSVEVTPQKDGYLLFSFMHPWKMYGKKLPHSLKSLFRKEKSSYTDNNKELPEFKYSVVVGSQKQPQHDFRCVTSPCEEKLPMEDIGVENCLKITGEVKKMAVKSTQLYCTAPLPVKKTDDNNYIIYIVISVLVVSVVAFILFLVYQKKTKPSSAIPKSISISRNIPEKVATVKEQISVAKVEPSSPTPLLSYPEENEFTRAGTSFEPDLRLRIGIYKDEDVCDQGGRQPNDEGHGYMKGSDMDEDGTSLSGGVPSGYEKRQVLVELGRDELAEGYRV